MGIGQPLPVLRSSPFRTSTHIEFPRVETSPSNILPRISQPSEMRVCVFDLSYKGSVPILSPAKPEGKIVARRAQKLLKGRFSSNVLFYGVDAMRFFAHLSVSQYFGRSSRRIQVGGRFCRHFLFLE